MGGCDGYGGGGRDWERMPESVTASGAKATKGEYGFRYGASIPRPMLMAFNKARARTHTHTHTHAPYL